MSVLTGTGLNGVKAECRITLEAWNGDQFLARWHHRHQDETDKCLWEICERQNGPRITHFVLKRVGFEDQRIPY